MIKPKDHFSKIIHKFHGQSYWTQNIISHEYANIDYDYMVVAPFLLKRNSRKYY